ncbi:hypothetical protein [uncultured Variovorax sp.]|uniref:hypothetical protein n=1 Tax=uncultured Variovorax sp. TaxID=114708 RepID=UPI0025DF5A63|nr:hypothetical protein [uncultured Variovorax sp.]
MQTSDETGHRAASATTQAPTLDERMGAVENFLQQLVLLLEVEPELTRENIAAWIELTNKCAAAHGLQSSRERAAMDWLCGRVLSPAVDVAPSASEWLS